MRSIQTSYEPESGWEALEGAAAPGGAGSATREKILDAAERLFAEHGFAATSHRQITAEAGVNLAAVNYHFGSKEELFVEVVRRRLEPVNRRRLELLEEAERRSGGARLEDVARAFVAPVVEARDEGGEPGALPKLMARVVGEPGGWAERLLPLVFAGVAARFLASLERMMPEAKREDLLWGLVFSAGALAHYLLMGGLIRRVAGGAAEAEAGEAVERMARYITAGLRAVAGTGEGPKKARSGAAREASRRKSAKGRRKA